MSTDLLVESAAGAARFGGCMQSGWVELPHRRSSPRVYVLTDFLGGRTEDPVVRIAGAWKVSDMMAEPDFLEGVEWKVEVRQVIRIGRFSGGSSSSVSR